MVNPAKKRPVGVYGCESRDKPFRHAHPTVDPHPCILRERDQQSSIYLVQCGRIPAGSLHIRSAFSARPGHPSFFLSDRLLPR
jgi:hypothetical protein